MAAALEFKLARGDLVTIDNMPWVVVGVGANGWFSAKPDGQPAAKTQGQTCG